ncbi:MAG: DEAD/DEAH box helicase [Cyanosarcina radialis HA8281-LM2]|jgi:SNF2 family DNA or RNA helicase|nr:DEAD/DEAH box helicase [Cyanosarcina radialis HA8281-LM2]
MGILHGSWVDKTENAYLFIWGETWRRITQAPADRSEKLPLHPLAMTREELISFLATQKIATEKLLAAGKPTGDRAIERWTTETIALPTVETGESASPLYSASLTDDATTSLSLQLWEVEGFCLHPLEAIEFLRLLPLGSFQESNINIGGDLRFWVHVCRWTLDLLARGKFLPGLHRQSDGAFVAIWQPLLDSTIDRTRLEKFAEIMPAACRAYGEGEKGRGRWGDGEMGRWGEREDKGSSSKLINSEFRIPNSELYLLLSFLRGAIDAQVRSWITNQALPSSDGRALSEWLNALGKLSPTGFALASSTPSDLERLESVLQAWAMPLQEHLIDPASQGLGQNRFRTCFELQPPAAGETDWNLKYGLQAVDNPDFLVDAAEIWQHPIESWEDRGRTIARPQETFLKGLGLALRLYPRIEESLQQPQPQSCRLDAIAAYEFVRGTAWRLQDNGLGVVMPPSLMPGTSSSGKLGLKIEADVADSKGRLGLQSLLKFNLQLAIGDRTVSKKEFDRLMALKTPLVEVNGEWIALQPQDVRAAEAILAIRPEQLSLSVEDALRLSTGDSKTIEKLPVVSFAASGVLEEIINHLTNNQAIAAIEPPESFRGQLRPYQARGAGWLSFLERWGLGACLADDMGLGKTVQFIAFMLYLQEQKALENPTLIVCPTSVLGNWEREIKKFGPTLKTLVHHGDKRAKGKEFAKAIKGKDLIISSYSLAYRDAKTLESISWQGIVLDEAQNIKNSEAKQSQAIRQLSASFRIALTGTPVENRLSELWSILDFLNPGYLGNRQFFQRRFAMPIEKYGDTASLRTLRSLVQPFILRRLKTDRTIIQDLPDKQEMNVFCGLTAEQAALYQKNVDESLAAIEESEGIQRRGLILTLLMKLKQICNHPAHFLKENTLVSSQRSGKLQRLEEMLEEIVAEGDRALIFTQFAEMGKLLQPYLQKQLGEETLFLYGATRKPQREEAIDRFQNDPTGPKIFILSLKAGGTGLNLTRANHVFHFDRWWNPAVENQATDRVFRIGQTRNVQVHKFVCSGTLEEKINETIESKKQLAGQTVDAGEQWLTEMDTDKLRSLLLLDRSAAIDEE